MNSSLFTIKLKDIAGATVSAVIAAVLAYLSTLTSLTSISWQGILIVAATTACASLAKAFSTDNNGNLLGGSFKVK